MLPKNYPFKVAGVSFGNRQQTLKVLYDTGADFEVELRPYEYEGSPALAVLFDGFEVGSIRESDVEAVSDILENKDPFVGGEIDVFETDEGGLMYSAKVQLVVDETPPELRKKSPAPEPKPEPQPLPPKKRKFYLSAGAVFAILGIGIFAITGDAPSFVLVALGAFLVAAALKK